MRINKTLLMALFGLVIVIVSGCNNSENSPSGATTPSSPPAGTNVSTNLPPMPGK